MGECKEIGIYLVLMTGGEPFLRKDLFDLFEKHEELQILDRRLQIEKS
jgi:MoaA/NifB/PqqE/SkfB family radical SAM enzyme